MIEELGYIREQLFDAPVEVKESFNNLVNWFDDNGYWILLYRTDSFDGYKIHNDRSVNRLFANRDKKIGEWSGHPGSYRKLVAGPFKTKKEAEKKLESIQK